MAETTKIEWTGATWNPITGCSIKSPGCLHCYAMNLAATRLQHHPSRAGLTMQTKAGPVWTGEVKFNEKWLDQPLRWKTPKDIFVVAHGDLFHESVPDEWIDRVFSVMALAPWHRFQVLTKRPERAENYLRSRARGSGNIGGEAVGIIQRFESRTEGGVTTSYPRRAAQRRDGVIEITYARMPHVWVGASVERQPEADERRPHLAAIAADGWNTWVSYEPALGMVDWAGWEFIRWFVGGGESGPKARPSHPDWHRAARDFCVAHDVPYFFKQWGSWAPHIVQAGGDLGGDVRAGRVRIVHPTGQTDVEVSIATGGRSTIPGSRYMANVGKKAAGHLLDGVEWHQFPSAAR